MANYLTATGDRFKAKLEDYKKKNPNLTDTVARKRISIDRTK